MTRVLEDRESHALVQHDDGTVELIPWSPMNRLVYRHGLEDLLRSGTEIYTIKNDDRPDITITPHRDATAFTIEFGNEEVHVAEHEKSDFVDALSEAAENADEHGLDPNPIIRFASSLFDSAVNPMLVDDAADVLDGDIVVKEKGWLINGTVLLTYDNEFYHPETTAVNSSGAVIGSNANQIAYDLRLHGEGQTDIDDWNSLADMGEQAEFLARAMWALTFVPGDVEPVA